MKILVLGRSGQIASALPAALGGIGEVMALGRPELDVLDARALEAAIVSAAPDTVINAVAYTAVDAAESDREAAEALNLGLPARLAALAARDGFRLVHYSTDYVFDGGKDAPYAEGDAPNPINVYGASKMAGDRAILESGAAALILRVSWVHAPAGRNFVATIVQRAREATALQVVDDQVGAPTSAALIAQATATAIAQGGRGLHHLVAGGETSWNGVARFAVAEALAAGARLTLGPDDVAAVATDQSARPARRPLNSRLDTGKFRGAFGFALPDWRDGVRETVRAIIAGGK